MTPAAFHLAILRSVALIVPQPRRADWLAEWCSELWHVRRDADEPAATAFCMGAFRDAFWHWKNGASLESRSILSLDRSVAPAVMEHFGDQALTAPSSPGQCLTLLAAAGAVCFVIALLLPAARHALLYSPFPGDLVLLAPADPGDSPVSPRRFEQLKAHRNGQFIGLAFYSPVHLQVQTPHGKRHLFVARTTADLFRLMKTPIPLGQSTGLVLNRAAWRNYFDSDPQIPSVDVGWEFPGGVEGWLIEDASVFPALTPDTPGCVVGKLTYAALHDTSLHHGSSPGSTFRDGEFRFAHLQKRSSELPRLIVIFLSTGMLLGILMSGFPQSRPKSIGPRRGLFLAAKTLLVVPIVFFGSLDLGSLGASASPLVMHMAFFAGLFAVRWIVADQRGRCPVCLRLLANPVRMGESSRILLEWHGTELMCLRGHGMLYIPEWPAIWSGRQRWMHLGPSWGGLFHLKQRFPVTRT